jgi:hypothetical protein
VTRKTEVRWTVVPTDRITTQINHAYKTLDHWVRKNDNLKNREIYLIKTEFLDKFQQFILHGSAKGPDKYFEEVPSDGTVPTFYVRQVGPWTGYCGIDSEKKTLRWDFATHDGELC